MDAYRYAPNSVIYPLPACRSGLGVKHARSCAPAESGRPTRIRTRARRESRIQAPLSGKTHAKYATEQYSFGMKSQGPLSLCVFPLSSGVQKRC